MQDYTKHEIYEFLWLAVYIVVVLGIFTLFSGFGLGGFEREEVFIKNNFYIPYGILFLVGIIALKIAGIFVFGKKNSQFEGVVVHDPIQSPFGKFKIFRYPLLLTLGTLIFFGILGYLATVNQTFFNDVPRFEQQFTPAADLFFSVYPASPSETLGAIFLISLFGFILGLFAVKKKMSFMTFFILFLIGAPLISMTYGYINHLARYGDSEIAIQSVLIFWFFGGLITALTGSVIPFLIMHDLNNFYIKASEIFASDALTFITFSVLGLMIIFMIFLILRKNKKPQIS